MTEKNLERLKPKTRGFLGESTVIDKTGPEVRYLTTYGDDNTSRLSTFVTKAIEPNIDKFGRATFTDPSEQISLIIAEYDKKGGVMNVSLNKLLMALMQRFSDQVPWRPKNPITGDQLRVNLHINEFLELIGTPPTKPNRDKYRPIIRESLNTLYSLSVRWSEKGRGSKDPEDMRIIQEKNDPIRNNRIYVMFSNNFGNYLANTFVTQISQKVLAIDGRNPLAFSLGVMLGHRYANIVNRTSNPPTHDIISVEALLRWCPSIPTAEQVRQDWKDGKHRRSLNKAIIDPLERALDAGGDAYRWNYCNKKKEPLTDDQLKNMSYDVFIGLSIQYDFIDYPDMKEAENRRRKRITEAKKRKAAATLKASKRQAK